MRADARRNREQLLRAAAETFAEQGVEASLDEIARRAGVGIGTLYRHFPSRDALIADVYRAEVERLCGDANALLHADPVVGGLETWMHQFVDYAATKRGMAHALRSMVGDQSELFDYSRGLMHDAVRRLVTAAVEAGQVRSDANADDLLRGLSGFCMASEDPGWQDQAHRLVTLLVDGLRYPVNAVR